MPLIKKIFLQKNLQIGIWQIDEPEEWFIERLWLCHEELVELGDLKNRKRLEWLADRYVLHDLIGEKDRFACIKDEFGKPFLDGSDIKISLSNSADKAAAIISEKSVGIDIQYITPKIQRIANKYMRDDEMICIEYVTSLEHLHVFWGAKEALYKAYGKRELDFKKHIILTPFSYDLTNGKAEGKVQKDDFVTFYDIFYEKMDNFILVSCVEK